MDCNRLFDLGYDVVVAITQQAISGQLILMSDPDLGSINTNVIVSYEPSQSTTNGKQGPHDDIPHFYADYESVPKITTPDGRSVPQWATVDGRFTPTFSIGPNNPSNDDGRAQKVVLKMTWDSGTLYAADQVHTWDMTGWTWEAAVELKISIITAADLDQAKGLAVPIKVFNQLYKLTIGGAQVLSLELNFVAGGQWTCRTASNTDPAASIANQDAMSPYFYSFVKNPRSNPYFLAYNSQYQYSAAVFSPDTDLHSFPVAETGVAPSLSPVGCTFSLFYDETNHDRSTVNFIFNTKAYPTGDPHPSTGVNKYPGTFAQSLLSPTDQCDGKIIYSPRSFLESMILRPLKNRIGDTDDFVATPPLQYEVLYTSQGPPGRMLGVLMSGEKLDRFSLNAVQSDPDNTKPAAWTIKILSDLVGGVNSNGNPVLMVQAPTFVDGHTPLAPSDIRDRLMKALSDFSASPPETFAQNQIMLPFGGSFFEKVSPLQAALGIFR